MPLRSCRLTDAGLSVHMYLSRPCRLTETHVVMMLMMVLVCLCVRNFRSYSLIETHVVGMLIIVWSVCVYVPMQALQ